jgi:hypothetical protein
MEQERVMDRPGPQAPAALADVAGTGCALVSVRPADASGPVRGQRSTAPFLAHLIATQRQEPQTRDRRRAEPVEAAHAYERALADRPTAKGRALSRAM